MTTLKPFFSYFGSKWRIAKHYPTPVHDTIIEPFCGSAGYSLRHPEKKIILCDAYETVISIWQYLIDVSEAELRGLPDIRNDQTTDDLPVCDEAKLLIGFWLNPGTAVPVKSPNRWMREAPMKDGHRIQPQSQLYWSERLRNRIALQLPSIRHWTAIHCSYEDIVAGPATWFVDPPYAKLGKCYRHGSKDIDYGRLGDWCRARQGQAIVCEANGADWLPFESFHEAKGTKVANRNGKPREVIWIQ